MNYLYSLLNLLLPMPGTSGWVIFVEVLTFTFENFLLLCMAIYGLVLVFRVWRALAATPQPERAVQRVALIKRTAIRFAVLYLVWWCVFSVVGYGSDAMDRRGAGDCRRTTSPEYKDYYVEKCPVRGDKHGDRSLLRLYDAGTNELLAEEFVSNAEGPLEWRKTRLDEKGFDIPSKPYIVQGGGLDGIGTYGVSIELPPSWWSRLRAKLP